MRGQPAIPAGSEVVGWGAVSGDRTKQMTIVGNHVFGLV
jgi:hypothetical protein